MKLSNILAVVTGGASGLWEAAVRTLAAAGAKVALFDLNAGRGETVAAEIGRTFRAVDVTDEASLDADFAKAHAVHGQERALVSCAGIAIGEKTIRRDRETGAPLAYRIAVSARTVTINLIGTFACTAKSAASMLTLDPLEDGERGVIINTASVAAEEGQIGQVAYAASKAGVKGMTLPITRA